MTSKTKVTKKPKVEILSDGTKLITFEDPNLMDSINEWFKETFDIKGNLPSIKEIMNRSNM